MNYTILFVLVLLLKGTLADKQCKKTTFGVVGPVYSTNRFFKKDGAICDENVYKRKTLSVATSLFTKQTQTLDSTVLIIEGTFRDENCNIIPNAFLDVWQTDQEGYYPNLYINETNDVGCKGLIQANDEGKYYVKAVLPGSYGFGYKLPPFIPRHIHAIAAAKGHKSIGLQIGFKEDHILKNDFRAKLVQIEIMLDELTFEIKQRKNDKNQIENYINFDIVLEKDNEKNSQFDLVQNIEKTFCKDYFKLEQPLMICNKAFTKYIDPLTFLVSLLSIFYFIVISIGLYILNKVFRFAFRSSKQKQD